jgi:hypothetical protein
MGRRSPPTRSLAEEIVDGLDEFAAAVASGHPLATKFNCRTSQAIFAQLLGVSPKTVRAWEQGVNVPHEASCRLMDEVRRDPAYWRKRLSDAIVVR